VSAPYSAGQRPNPYAPQHAPPPTQPPPGYPPGPPQHGYAVPPQGYHPPYPYPQAPAQPQTQCRFCGNVPAAEVTFRGHRGMLVMMQFRHLKGPFCRDCGLATFREMSAKTLIQGWYGYASFVITPITVLVNAARRGKVATLDAPRPPAHGPSGRPMDPGAPLLARPSALIGLAIPVVLIMLVVFYFAWLAVTTV
jgi:hypothetical protein